MMPGKEVFPVGHLTMPHTTTSPVTLKLLLGVLTFAVAAACYFFTESPLLSSFVFLAVLVAGGILSVLQFSRSHHQGKEPVESILSERPTTTLQPLATSSQARPAQLSTSSALSGNRPTGFGTFDLSTSQPIDFNLRTTVEETVSRFSAMAQEKGIELSCLFSSDSPTPFRGDPGDLRLILMNLIDYALSSVIHGEVVVRGTLQQQTSTHATFHFSVSTLSLLPSTSVTSPVPNSSATPLSPSREEAGIAISKQLVKAFGGQLDVENRPDLSTTIGFTLTLEKQPPRFFLTYRHVQVSPECAYSLLVTTSFCRMKMSVRGDLSASEFRAPRPSCRS